MTQPPQRPILIAGMGSIGRRHLRIMRAAGWTNFVLYRTGKSTLPDVEQAIVGLPSFSDLDEALAQKPLAAIIANPTALHLKTAIQAARAGCHLLIEKPVSHQRYDIDELVRVVAEQRVQVMVGFQFRFHPTLKRIKAWLDEDRIGQIVHADASWGEYLPNWHTWEDYKDSYAARAELGGGVALTLCHPFDYLRWLIGEVVDVKAMSANRGQLDIAVEDTADALLKFENGAVGHVHVDYLQRPPAHTLRITGSRGLIVWDNADGIARIWQNGSDQPDTARPPEGFERDHLFKEQWNDFSVSIVENRPPRCTLHDGIRALEIALTVRDSL